MFTTIADKITFFLFHKTSIDSRFLESVNFFIKDSLEIFVLMFLIMTIVSFFRTKFDPRIIKINLKKKSKFIAYLLAVIFGAITPFCSCSSIPLFIGLIGAGVPFGICMAFLITSPLINEVATMLLLPVMGLKITIIYVLSGMTVGMFGGFLMEKLGFEKYIERGIAVMDIKKRRAAKFSRKERLNYALSYSCDIIKSIWLYVLIGIGIGAFLHGYIPSNVFTNNELFNNNLYAVPFAVLVGIPLYSNAIGIIPITEVFLSKGIPVGTVLAMMMSVIAISLPEMIILRKVLQTKLIMYFVLFLLASFILLGYFYNFIL